MKELKTVLFLFVNIGYNTKITNYKIPISNVNEKLQIGLNLSKYKHMAWEDSTKDRDIKIEKEEGVTKPEDTRSLSKRIDDFLGRKLKELSSELSMEKEKIGQNWHEKIIAKVDQIDDLKKQGDKDGMRRNIDASLDYYRELSFEDSLSRIYNRNALMEKGLAEFESAEAKKDPLTVLSLDLDYFKSYNAAFGHTFGDIIIQTLSKSLLKNLGDKVNVRLGGEEIFISIGANIPNVEEKVETILKQINTGIKAIFEQMNNEVGSPDYAQRNLARVILKERAEEVNKEFLGKSQFAKAREEMAEFSARGGSAFNGDFMDGKLTSDITPAKLMNLILDSIEQAENKKDLESLKKLNKIKDKFFVSIGTATAGALTVEFGEKMGQMNSEDLTEIKNYLQKNNLPKNILSYDDFFQWLNDELQKDGLTQEQKGELNSINSKIRKKRFGRVIDKVNLVAEEKKKETRAGFLVQNINIEEISLAKEKQIPQEVYAKLKEVEQGLLARVEQIMADHEPFSDKVFLKIEQAVRNAEIADIDLQEKSKKIQKSMYFDSLTKSLNREYFQNVVNEEFNYFKQRKQDYAIASLDFDNLKAVNETGGHKLGDLVLSLASQEFQKAIDRNREKYVLALKKKGFTDQELEKIKIDFIRLTGGEEFILTFPGLTSEESKEYVKDIQKQATEEIKKFLQTKCQGQDKSFFQQAGDYIGAELGRKEKREKENIGTFSFGIIDTKDLNEGDNIWSARQKADEAGESLKVLHNGLSRRGEVLTYREYNEFHEAVLNSPEYKSLDEKTKDLESQLEHAHQEKEKDILKIKELERLIVELKKEIEVFKKKEIARLMIEKA